MADPGSNTDQGKGSITLRSGPRSGEKVYLTHEASIIGGIKGLMDEARAKGDFTEGGKKVMTAADAVDKGVDDAPGNTSSY